MEDQVLMNVVYVMDLVFNNLIVIVKAMLRIALVIVLEMPWLICAVSAVDQVSKKENVIVLITTTDVIRSAVVVLQLIYAVFVEVQAFHKVNVIALVIL